MTREPLPAMGPCPFCGGEPELLSGAPGCHYVKCKGCNVATDDTGRERAIAAWNRRQPSAREAEHDIERHVAIAADLATEVEQMRELLQFALPIVRAADYGNLADDIARALSAKPQEG